MNIRQKKIMEVTKDIISKEDDNLVDFHGVLTYKYDNVKDYVLGLDSIFDKIVIAQWAYDFNYANSLFKQLNLTEEQYKIYSILLNKNENLIETINFEILQKKYFFLSENFDIITTNIDIQQQIISLSDEKLEIFKKMYIRLTEQTDYIIPLFTEILYNMGSTPFNDIKDKNDLLINDIISSNHQLTEEDIDNLIYIYSIKGVSFNLENYDDLKAFNTSNSKLKKDLDMMISNEKEAECKNLKLIKIAVLLKTFGLSFQTAELLCTKYDVKKISINNDNKDTIETLLSVMKIYNEENAEILFEVYDSISREINPKFNYLRVNILENDLRKIFAREYNNQVFKTVGNSVMIDGVNVYDAGIDFKMIVTAIGAYQSNFGNMENYEKYWNSGSIRSHGNCCSLIANNNLSMANVKNIILGFSTMSENMLLLSGEHDINSSPSSREFNMVRSQNKKFISPTDLIDNTRGDYNELVYERRDLSVDAPLYKKNPDYIVFIEEYENIDDEIKKYEGNKNEQDYIIEQKVNQENRWKESVKAAKQFDVPIVKINREKCAKSELEKIFRNLDLYKKTLNPQILSDIFIQFENNRVGNSNSHKLITEKYFSKLTILKIFDEILDVLTNYANPTVIDANIIELKKVITMEQKKVVKNRRFRNNKQNSGIKFKEFLEKLEQFENSYREMEGVEVIGKIL